MNNINNIVIFEGTTLFVQKKVKIILVSKINFSCGGKYLVQINDLFCGQIKANNWETTIWDWCPNRLMLWVWKTTVSGAKTGKNCPWHLWLMVHFYLTQILTLIWTALVFTDHQWLMSCCSFLCQFHCKILYYMTIWNIVLFDVDHLISPIM